MMQRDIILKVWLFLSRLALAKEKQRLSSSLSLDDDDTPQRHKAFWFGGKTNTFTRTSREEIPQKEI